LSFSLDQMGHDCARRLTAHDMMLRHLNLDPGPDEAPRLIGELRGTLRACIACPTPGRCVAWCGEGQSGAPRFCRGVGAFDALARALAAARDTRVA
jgi:hypothetical protein